MLRATGFCVVVLVSTSLAFSQVETRAEGQVYVRQGESWFVAEDGKLYPMLSGRITVKFNSSTTEEQIQHFLDAHGLEISNVNRLGIYELEVTAPEALIATLEEAKRSGWVEYVEPITTGEYLTAQTPVDEMMIRSQRFVRQDEKWYLDSNGTLYEVIPGSFSFKFERETTPQQRQEFLDTRGLTVIRQNRLGIYDVEIPPGKGVLQWLADLQDHPWLEYVEVNTLGVYAAK